MRVLIVDDDPVNRKLLTRMFGTVGVSCVEASNHAEAMQCVGLDELDSALVDINLGPEDGLDLAVLLRDMHRRFKIRLMSADPKNTEKVREAGFDAMLLKPFTLDELLDAIGFTP